MSLSRYLGKKTMFLLQKHDSFYNTDSDILEYGLIIFFSTIAKTAVVVLIALAFGLLKEIMLCAFIFGLLRTFAGGVHAKTPIGCLIGMLFTYFSVYLLSSIIPYSTYLFWISLAFCLFTVLLYAPADTAEKPILNPKQIKAMKLCSVLVLLIMYLLAFSFFTEAVKKIIIFSSIFECVTILPFMYSITKTERGDKYYEITE